MIVVDPSALMAVLKKEQQAEVCARALQGATLLMSAASLTECLIVAGSRDFLPQLEELLRRLAPDIIAVDESLARDAAAAYLRWGRGHHPAGLNYGDCFSYALAQSRGCPLLFVGDDFSQTDIRSAIVEHG